MGLSLSAQTAYFLWSLVLGLVLGILYDIVRATRMVLHAGRVHVMISDIVFFTICGVLTSLFALPFNKGDVRGFIIFGEAVGFLTYRLTLGSVMGKMYAALARVLRGFIQKMRNFLEKLFDFLLKAIARLVYNISVVIDKLRKKIAHRKKQRAAQANAKRRKRQSHKEHQHEQKKHQKAKHHGRYSAHSQRQRAKRG